MLVPSNSPLPTNSQTPMSAARIARSQRYLSKVDAAEKRARFAVLGYCAGPGSYRGLGLNVMSDVQQNPMTPIPNNTSSSLVTRSGSGVLDTVGGMAPPAPTVVPIDGSGQGVPNDPEYAPLTISNKRDLSRVTCPMRERQELQAASGSEAPDWGDAFAIPSEVSIASPVSGVLGWIKQHPGLAAAGLFVGALLASGAGSRRFGR